MKTDFNIRTVAEGVTLVLKHKYDVDAEQDRGFSRTSLAISAPGYSLRLMRTNRHGLHGLVDTSTLRGRVNGRKIASRDGPPHVEVIPERVYGALKGLLYRCIGCYDDTTHNFIRDQIENRLGVGFESSHYFDAKHQILVPRADVYVWSG